MKLGAVLYKPWKAVPADNTLIIGAWPEDDATYNITVPSQLRGQIIQLQNWAAAHYQALQGAKETVAKLSTLFDGIEDEV